MNIKELYIEAQELSTPELRDEIVSNLYKRSHQLCNEGVSYTKTKGMLEQKN